jgi:hypothetical protein
MAGLSGGDKRLHANQRDRSNCSHELFTIVHLGTPA